MATTETVATRGQLERSPEERVNWLSSTPFFLVHLLPFLAIFTGVTSKTIVLGVVLIFARMFFMTAIYHRYFSHKSFRLNRFWQFIFAFGGTTAAQKGPLWWAALHRDHHRYSDTDRDVHSPRKGFWWSHVGWILSNKYKSTKFENLPEFAKYPELRWVNKYNWIGPWALGLACLLIAGWSGLIIGFFLSTVIVWHGTFMVNSVTHVWGTRPFKTKAPDTSRNNLLIAVFTGGEGWHNNHHKYPLSARQGFYWWQIDLTYYVLLVLSWIGIVRDIKKPPSDILLEGRHALSWKWLRAGTYGLRPPHFFWIIIIIWALFSIWK